LVKSRAVLRHSPVTTQQCLARRSPISLLHRNKPELLLKNHELHYSQAVKIGDRVETSGQGGWDDNLHILELLADEIAQAFQNVERTLATAGAGWEHVVHVNSYHVGGLPLEVNEVMVRLYRYYMPNHTPIWTQIGVAALGLPTMMRLCPYDSGFSIASRYVFINSLLPTH